MRIFSLVILSSSSVLLAILLLMSAKRTTKKINKIIFVGLSIISFSLMNFSTFYNLGNSNNTNSTTETTTEETKVIENNNEEVSDNFTKSGVIDATIAMLRAFEKSPTENLTIDQRIAALDEKKDIKQYISDEALDYIYLNDFMKEEDGYYSTSIAILTLIKSIQAQGNTSISPVISDSQYVYLDEPTRSAQLPIDYFTGSNTYISLEMMYKDKKWKLAPYTFLQSLQLSNQLTTQE